jgi:hypothetical protein
MSNELIEGDEAGSYVVLKRLHPTECGITYPSKDAW